MADATDYKDKFRELINREVDSLLVQSEPVATVHARILYITPDSALSLFQSTAPLVITHGALPIDSKIMGCGFDVPTQRFYLVIESADYSPVPEGSVLPEVPDIHFQRFQP